MSEPSRPEVSVIIVFLDDERFLSEAIESVRAQTFDDWELILVDDGSSDGSQQIARSWIDRELGRSRYLTHPERENRGISAARNLGLKESRGGLIALLDSDDVWLPHTLWATPATNRCAPWPPGVRRDLGLRRG